MFRYEVDGMKFISGVEFEKPIKEEKDFVYRIKSGEHRIFTADFE